MDDQAFLLINLALLFYSIGVWSERFQRQLKVWHLFMFFLGVICDSWGTGIMFDMAGGMTFDVHGISGLLAIVLMLVHAVWASWVLWSKNASLMTKFHRFSLLVWGIWLIPYFSPMFFALAS
jgi:uncharacterized repeat protein (TIGR03987 family)